MKYTVLIDENAHFDDEEGQYTLAEFDHAESALAACRRVIDEFLLAAYRPGMGADALFSQFRSFGEDAHIVSDDPHVKFSGWDYARERCREIADQL